MNAKGSRQTPLIRPCQGDERAAIIAIINAAADAYRGIIPRPVARALHVE
jgi:hypothetical protein